MTTGGIKLHVCDALNGLLTDGLPVQCELDIAPGTSWQQLQQLLQQTATQLGMRDAPEYSLAVRLLSTDPSTAGSAARPLQALQIAGAEMWDALVPQQQQQQKVAAPAPPAASSLPLLRWLLAHLTVRPLTLPQRQEVFHGLMLMASTITDTDAATVFPLALQHLLPLLLKEVAAAACFAASKVEESAHEGTLAEVCLSVGTLWWLLEAARAAAMAAAATAAAAPLASGLTRAATRRLLLPQSSEPVPGADLVPTLLQKGLLKQLFAVLVQLCRTVDQLNHPGHLRSSGVRFSRLRILAAWSMGLLSHVLTLPAVTEALCWQCMPPAPPAPASDDGDNGSDAIAPPAPADVPKPLSLGVEAAALWSTLLVTAASPIVMVVPPPPLDTALTANPGVAACNILRAFRAYIDRRKWLHLLRQMRARSVMPSTRRPPPPGQQQAQRSVDDEDSILTPQERIKLTRLQAADRAQRGGGRSSALAHLASLEHYFDVTAESHAGVAAAQCALALAVGRQELGRHWLAHSDVGALSRLLDPALPMRVRHMGVCLFGLFVRNGRAGLAALAGRPGFNPHSLLQQLLPLALLEDAEYELRYSQTMFTQKGPRDYSFGPIGDERWAECGSEISLHAACCVWACAVIIAQQAAVTAGQAAAGTADTSNGHNMTLMSHKAPQPTEGPPPPTPLETSVAALMRTLAVASGRPRVGAAAHALAVALAAVAAEPTCAATLMKLSLVDDSGGDALRNKAPRRALSRRLTRAKSSHAATASAAGSMSAAAAAASAALVAGPPGGLLNALLDPETMGLAESAVVVVGLLLRPGPALRRDVLSHPLPPLRSSMARSPHSRSYSRPTSPAYLRRAGSSTMSPSGQRPSSPQSPSLRQQPNGHVATTPKSPGAQSSTSRPPSAGRPLSPPRSSPHQRPPSASKFPLGSPVGRPGSPTVGGAFSPSRGGGRPHSPNRPHSTSLKFQGLGDDEEEEKGEKETAAVALYGRRQQLLFGGAWGTLGSALALCYAGGGSDGGETVADVERMAALSFNWLAKQFVQEVSSLSAADDGGAGGCGAASATAGVSTNTTASSVQQLEPVTWEAARAVWQAGVRRPASSSQSPCLPSSDSSRGVVVLQRGGLEASVEASTEAPASPRPTRREVLLRLLARSFVRPAGHAAASPGAAKAAEGPFGALSLLLQSADPQAMLAACRSVFRLAAVPELVDLLGDANVVFGLVRVVRWWTDLLPAQRFEHRAVAECALSALLLLTSASGTSGANLARLGSAWKAVNREDAARQEMHNFGYPTHTPPGETPRQKESQRMAPDLMAATQWCGYGWGNKHATASSNGGGGSCTSATGGPTRLGGFSKGEASLADMAAGGSGGGMDDGGAESASPQSMTVSAVDPVMLLLQVSVLRVPVTGLARASMRRSTMARIASDARTAYPGGPAGTLTSPSAGSVSRPPPEPSVVKLQSLLLLRLLAQDQELRVRLVNCGGGRQLEELARDEDCDGATRMAASAVWLDVSLTAEGRDPRWWSSVLPATEVEAAAVTAAATATSNGTSGTAAATAAAAASAGGTGVTDGALQRLHMRAQAIMTVSMLVSSSAEQRLLGARSASRLLATGGDHAKALFLSADGLPAVLQAALLAPGVPLALQAAGCIVLLNLSSHVPAQPKICQAAAHLLLDLNIKYAAAGSTGGVSGAEGQGGGGGDGGALRAHLAAVAEPRVIMVDPEEEDIVAAAQWVSDILYGSSGALWNLSRHPDNVHLMYKLELAAKSSGIVAAALQRHADAVEREARSSGLSHDHRAARRADHSGLSESTHAAIMQDTDSPSECAKAAVAFSRPPRLTLHDPSVKFVEPTVEVGRQQQQQQQYHLSDQEAGRTGGTSSQRSTGIYTATSRPDPLVVPASETVPLTDPQHKVPLPHLHQALRQPLSTTWAPLHVDVHEGPAVPLFRVIAAAVQPCDSRLTSSAPSSPSGAASRHLSGLSRQSSNVSHQVLPPAQQAAAATAHTNVISRWSSHVRSGAADGTKRSLHDAPDSSVHTALPPQEGAASPARHRGASPASPRSPSSPHHKAQPQSNDASSRPLPAGASPLRAASTTSRPHHSSDHHRPRPASSPAAASTAHASAATGAGRDHSPGGIGPRTPGRTGLSNPTCKMSEAAVANKAPAAATAAAAAAGGQSMLSLVEGVMRGVDVNWRRRTNCDAIAAVTARKSHHADAGTHMESTSGLPAAPKALVDPHVAPSCASPHALGPSQGTPDRRTAALHEFESLPGTRWWPQHGGSRVALDAWAELDTARDDATSPQVYVYHGRKTRVDEVVLPPDDDVQQYRKKLCAGLEGDEDEDDLLNTDVLFRAAELPLLPTFPKLVCPSPPPPSRASPSPLTAVSFTNLCGVITPILDPKAPRKATAPSSVPPANKTSKAPKPLQRKR